MLNKVLKKIDYEVRKIPHVTIYSPSQRINTARRNVNVNWLETAYTIHIFKAFMLGFIDHPCGGSGTLPTINMAQEEVAFYEAGGYEAWCEQNISCKWIKYEDRDSYVFAFEDEGDAAAFKMFI